MRILRTRLQTPARKHKFSQSTFTRSCTREATRIVSLRGLLVNPFLRLNRFRSNFHRDFPCGFRNNYWAGWETTNPFGRERAKRWVGFPDYYRARRHGEKYRFGIVCWRSVSRLRSPIEACAVLIRDTHGLFARGTIADPFFMLAPSRVTTLVKLQKPKANRSGDGP